MQDQTIRRLADGSIDYNHYTREGRRLRAQAQREFFKGGVIRPLVAIAVIFAPLALAGIAHKLRGSVVTAAKASLSIAQNER